jgi:hypothetical protein
MVFDPNILPNAASNTCAQVVSSSLKNATRNCLTSLTALQNETMTNNSAEVAANVGNPI